MTVVQCSAVSLQARFTEALLHGAAGVPIPAERIFSTTSTGQPKSEVLQHLEQQHPGAPAFHFVEDKLGTLHKVGQVPAGAMRSSVANPYVLPLEKQEGQRVQDGLDAPAKPSQWNDGDSCCIGLSC